MTSVFLNKNNICTRQRGSTNKTQQSVIVSDSTNKTHRREQFRRKHTKKNIRKSRSIENDSIKAKAIQE